MKSKKACVITFFMLLVSSVCLSAGKWPDVPGVVIDHSPASSRSYIGSPSIAVLPNGDYVASHDRFGPGTKNNQSVVFASRDKGCTWKELSEIQGQWWSTLFTHKGELYIMGTSSVYGYCVIRRSDDGGKTWTTPVDSSTGLLHADGKYHCAPVPVKIHDGRIWRAMEDAMDPGGWGHHFRAFMMSAPVDTDLLKASNWTGSNRLSYDEKLWPGKGWLEGNAVITPDGDIVNILRVDSPETAALIRVSPDGKTSSFDPKKDLIKFHGGAAKFTIRFDPVAKRYFSLVDKQRNPEAYRNRLVLVSSTDLRNWNVEKVVLEHPDPKAHAWQYIDWLFAGDDIIFVSRTAYDDGLGGAHRAHDANFMTFHRIRNFRQLKK
jgi:hypothetical protein